MLGIIKQTYSARSIFNTYTELAPTYFQNGGTDGYQMNTQTQIVSLIYIKTSVFIKLT